MKLVVIVAPCFTAALSSSSIDGDQMMQVIKGCWQLSGGHGCDTCDSITSLRGNPAESKSTRLATCSRTSVLAEASETQTGQAEMLRSRTLHPLCRQASPPLTQQVKLPYCTHMITQLAQQMHANFPEKQACDSISAAQTYTGLQSPSLVSTFGRAATRGTCRC